MNNPFAPATPVAKKLKVLLYGPSGSGKTLAALSFPRVAVIDAEGGTDLYAGRPGVPPFSVLRIKTLTDLENAVAFIQADKGSTFDTLVIDPITVFYDVQKEATARASKTGDLGFKEWGKVNNRMKAVYHALTNLPVHVVVIARETVEYEGEGLNLRKVGTKPDADKALIYMMDFVIHLNDRHQGTVKKSRGIVLGNGGVLPEVNWAALEPAALAYIQGDRVQQQSEADAADQQSADLRERENAEAFVTHWRAEGLSDGDLLAALGVARISLWRKGRKAADEAVQSYIEARLARTIEGELNRMVDSVGKPDTTGGK